MDDLRHEEKNIGRKQKTLKRIPANYTQEEKIVMAVWYHEKPYSRLTQQQLLDNFRVRFNKKPPKPRSMHLWESALFTSNSINRRYYRKRTKGQYMQVPYVKESFRTHPHLTIKQRALLTGLNKTVLYELINKHITEEEIEELKKEGQKEIPVKNQEKEELQNE
ncbi:unnamed protein product [Callosobruchus maculatus]|uniref:DUF4817 domain-containing protein n=1 Tax=Callosobruchus maculatus TaxID=64391 RepID=A0A653C635_CALMS|nr:unnamed protein product [Callosobruchus maculatus]